MISQATPTIRQMPAEAASRERFDERLAVFADHFLIAEVNGKAVGFIDGMVTEGPYIEDVMFEKAQMHRPDGAWQSIFGLNTLPEFRRRGYAAKLMNAFIALAQPKVSPSGLMCVIIRGRSELFIVFKISLSISYKITQK